ncbi:DUF4974 domain-containing protein [Pedobacter sp. V48]|uniref:DUF4974 domain-containing protein n=1 Tax=Pedobacter sp. V48 TaxID=509635 RepID=UPI0004B19BF1|nr:DUF4974 domain-containing protein [Pedobacter sp. V48]
MQSEEQIKRIVSLIGKQIRGELNAIDERDLEIWISESKTNKILFDQLTHSAYRQVELMKMRSFTSAPAAFANFMEKYGDRILTEDEVYISPKPELTKKWDYEFLKYGATAIILLALSTGFFIYLESREAIENKDSQANLLNQSKILRTTDQSSMVRSSPHLALIAKDAPNYGIDIKEALTWKQGFFTFKNETLESLMKKIESWYGVDVIYADGNIGKTLYTGSASRYSNIYTLLNKLDRTGPAKFKIEGNRIMVQLRYR